MTGVMHLNEKEPFFALRVYDDVDIAFADISDGSDVQGEIEHIHDRFFELPLGERPVRFLLIRSESESFFALKCSHIALDGFGTFCFVGFIGDIYTRLMRGEDVPVDGHPVWLDVYREDREHFASAKFTRDMEFWKRHLERIPEKRIFRARPGHADVLGNSRHRKFHLGEETSRIIDRVILRYGISPNIYFTALHALIVSFMCDEKQFVILNPVAFGERKVLHRRQGYQVAMPPVLIDLNEHGSIAGLFEDISVQGRTFYRHIRTPHQVAMRELPHKNFSCLGDMFVNFIPGMPSGSPEFPIKTAEQVHGRHEDLVLGMMVLREAETDTFSLTVRSSCNHLSEQDVERYVRRVELVSRQLDAGAEMADLSMLLDEEERELRVWQNGARREYPPATIPDLFDAVAGRLRDRPAVRDEAGGELSYATLGERSLRCAQWLRDKGVRRGDRVAVHARRVRCLPEIILGIMRIGAVYLPLDPASPPERLRLILDDAEPALVMDAARPEHENSVPAEVSETTDSAEGAYLIYTSGSTGRPKGVLVPHRGFANMIQGQIEIFGVRPEDRVLQFASPAFDASLSEIFMALLAGASLYPVSENLRSEPWNLQAYMADNAVSVATLPPSYLHLLDRDGYCPRVLITAGEAPIARDALHLAGRCAYFNAYGPTETSVCATIKRVLPDSSQPIGCGRPIPNVRAHVLDSGRRPLPAGMVGELHVGGAGLALGYHGNAEMTARRFFPLSGAGGEMVYATGDLASWSEDGDLMLVGRTDDQVKIRGNRVELGEVTALLETCDVVSQAFVLASRDAADQTALAAFLVLRPGGAIDSVVRWSKDNLPGYMIPSFWHELGAMPVTVTGKIDREALRAIVGRDGSASSGGAAPDPRLLRIFERTLGYAYDPQRDFFAQGGDSLKAMALLHEIRAAYSVDVAFREFVRCASLHDVAELLRRKRPAAEVAHCNQAPLNRNQYRLWAYQQANEGSIDYNMPLLMRVRGERAAAFVDALTEAIGRQELLGCTVQGQIDAPFFRRNPDVAIPVGRSAFPDFDSAQRHMQELIHTPFDLRVQCPVRLEIAEAGDALAVLLLLHHLAGDADSIELLLADALRGMRGERGAAGRLATQAAFCAREEAYLRSADFAADKAYWDAVFAPPSAWLHASPRRKGGMAAIGLAPALVADLEALARQAGSSLLSCFVTLVAAFLRARYARPELLIGVPVGLRESGDESGTVGFFVNTVALRLREGSPDVIEAVEETSALLKEAVAHSRYCGSKAADVLATHAPVPRVEEDGLVVDMLAPELKASKLTASFTLESGARSRVVLEYDALFIDDGASLLAEFLDYVGAAVGAAEAPEDRQVLDRAWTEMLGQKPGEDSDFFMDGGDSIKAIQMTGMLHRRGVTALGAADFLRTPRFADLCALVAAGNAPAQAVRLAPVEGGQRVPLSPLQDALVRDHPQHWTRFFMALPLDLDASVAESALEDWLRTLPDRHEALRLAFSRDGAVMLAKPHRVSLTRCAVEPGLTQEDAARAVARAVLAGLDPEQGATFGAGLAELQGRRLLLLAGHHLVLDAVSLDRLRQDLVAFTRDGARTDETCGMATRAVEMRRLAEAGDFPGQNAYAFWESVCRAPGAHLGALQDDGVDRALERVFLQRRVDGAGRGHSRTVLKELLTDLARALHVQGQREPLFATLESHGRDELLPGADLSQSVGWFTAVCPMPLRPMAVDADAALGFDPDEHFTPGNCTAYGYLRQAHPDVFRYESQISLNYLGRLRTGSDGVCRVLPALGLPGAIPELLHPDFLPDNPLDLVVFADDAGSLHLGAYFSPSVLAADWTAGLLDAWAGLLAARAAERSGAPEEVPAAVMEKSRCRPEDIERIAAPGDCHEPMLYERLAGDRSVYTQQVAFHFRGDADDFLLLGAWREVLARHESLRALFPMTFDGEFHRLILRQARTSAAYHDLSHLPGAMAEEKMGALLDAARRDALDPDAGPLLRAQLFRLGPERFAFSWCCHHLLMDGWCIGILLRELFALHDGLRKGLSANLPEPADLAAYDRWLADFDRQGARRYWAGLLEGAPRTRVCQRGACAAGVDPATFEMDLDRQCTTRLQMAARSSSVTLSVLVQALWAMLLDAERGGSRDVVYGVVTSGRPAEVEGMDRAVGLFIRTLPLRVQWSEGDSLGGLLRDLKERHLEQLRHGYLPLAEMGRDLFDHLMVVENYPTENLFDASRLELLRVQGFEKIPYPLGISVIPGDALRVRFLYDPSRMDPERVRGMGERLQRLAQSVPADGVVTCAALETLAAAAGGQTVHAATMPSTEACGVGRPADVAGPGLRTPDAAADAIRDIYESVLRRPVPSDEADFFQLGGHSLLAMRVLALVGRRLQVRLTIEDILTHSSVRALAARVRGAAPSAVRIDRAPRRDRYPLSASQKRIWFLQRLHEDSGVYQIPFAARLGAAVDPELLQEALRLLEARHDALRLRVLADEPEQVLAEPGALRLECHDRPYTPDALRGMAFGPDRPLVRAALFREEDGGQVLALCLHHIVFDGWSAEILLRELNQACAAVLRGTEPDWRPLELNYVGYVEWELAQQPIDAEALRARLLPLPESLKLPLDFPRPAVQSLDGAVVAFALGRERSRGLKRRAEELGVTLFPMLLALVQTFVYRHTGQSDMVIGCPAANRELAQVQDMVGLFVNTLAVRTSPAAERGFSSLVRDVQQAFQEALAVQSHTFEKLLEALRLERNPSRNLLFDVFVALEDASWSDYDQPPLRLQPLPMPPAGSKFDLSFYFREDRNGDFDVHIEYCTALFREETILLMRERLVVLLDAVLEKVDVPLSRLAILPDRERAVIEACNETAANLDIQRDADTCFREQVRRRGAAVALRDAAGESCTYSELDEMVSRLAVRLQAGGLGRGDFAGVCFERSVDMIVAIFAVLRVGAAYVPLSPSLPQPRLASMLEDLGVCMIICEAEFAGAFAGSGRTVLHPDPSEPQGVFAPVSVAPDSIAYVIFTSGSTGRPKGVPIEHRSLLNRILWMQSRFPIGAGDVILQKTTVSFDVSVWELFWWSWVGAALALPEPGVEKDPARMVEAVEVHRVTVLHFVPSMLRTFLDHLEARPHEVRRLASLRYVFTSGEALTADLVARFQALLPCELHNLYGPTEAAIDVTWFPCLDFSGHAVPIGRPVSNTRIHVLDDALQPVPLGVTGELYISGVQVAPGYLRRPDLTAAAFREDPFHPGSRMYRSGDLGRRLTDGNIEYLGRNDDQVKIRGFRIELGEVESALSRCSGVSQAVVRVGQVGGQPALEAFVLPHANARLVHADLRRELAGLLPEYMWPATVAVTDEIPLSPSGKADRKRVTGRRLMPAGRDVPGAGSALQEEIRAIWRAILPELADVDLDLGFFEAGGNSLLLVKLYKTLDERWPGVFSLAGLFAESSVREQAARIEDRHGRRATAAVRNAAEGPVAVIGMAVRLGDYEDLDSFWDDLAHGRDKNVPLPAGRRQEVRQIFEAVGLPFDPARLREASYLADVSSFDPRRFGMSPGDAAMLDPRQRLFLQTALHALDDAGYGGAALEDAPVGVFVGASPYRLFQDAVTRAFPDQAEQTYLLNVPSNVVARISHLKNWTGPGETVDTACSSVLKAVHDACRSLRAGECRVAVAGGAHIIDLPVRTDAAFTIESGSGQTRTFDARADGVGAGEGAAVFVLKLLDQAVRDGDAIHAVIAGSAVNQDGRSSSMAAPNPNGQAEVIALAAADASVALADIDVFEAHGTATVLGDPVEIEGLTLAFARSGRPQARKALVGSVKGNIGHLDAAAGALGLAKAVMCLKHGAVPPQPHFETPNPHIDFEVAPVRVARVLEPLPSTDRPWHCGVSSFGLSGINVHVVLREHAGAVPPGDDGSWYCVPLSAGSEAGLAAYCRMLREAVVRNGWPLHAIAGTLIAGREHLEVRMAVCASSRQELLDGLEAGSGGVRVGRALRSGVPGAGFATRSEAVAAAEDFLQGQRLLWPEDRPLHRVHLPATPFERSPLWPRFRSRFMSVPVATPVGSSFTLDIGRDDYWPVAEHLLGGAPTLVGMAVIGLIGAAVGESALVIEQLSWLRPVVLADGDRATLVLNRKDGAMTVELQHLHRDAWRTAVRAAVRGGEAPPARLDLDALRNGMSLFEAPEGHALVRISRRWDCRESLWVSSAGDRLLSRLTLPEEFRPDLHSFPWHPALLDLAASLALHGSAGFVPARCGRIRLFKPLPPTIHAHVHVTDKNASLITASCTVTDQSGQVLLDMTELVFASVQPAAAEPELYGLRWSPAATAGADAVRAGRVMLLGPQDSPLAEALADMCDLRTALPQDEPERKAAAETIVAQGVSHLVHLSSPDGPHWAFAALMREVCRAGLRGRLHVIVLGSGVFASHETLPGSALDHGMLLSLCHEEPLLSGAYVELEAVSAASLGTLRDTLGRVHGSCLIRGDGGLLLPALERLAAGSERVAPGPGCVVVSGGLGGMALTLARAIADEWGARVVLLHRRERADAGGEFAAYRCDVNDAVQVRETLEAVRREVGPIVGVIHAAGIAGEGFLATKERAVYESVLAPKVTGTWNLHEATLGDDLGFFVMASSRSCLTGAPGQTDYTAANAYLNAFAHYRRARGLPALAICWNAWAGVGMAARLRADVGASPLHPDQAFGVLCRALGSGAPVVAVAMPDESVSAHRLAEVRSDLPAGREEPATMEAAGPGEAEILEIFRDCLGYEDQVTGEDDFYEFGGDSISGTRIVARIKEAFGVQVNVMDLLEAESIGGFVGIVLERAAAKQAAPPDIAPAPARESYPVGREQLSILYAQLRSGAHTGFNLPAFLRLPRDFDRKRLEEAVGELIRRHEVLRTTFRDFDKERPSMVIHPFTGFELQEVRLDDISRRSELITPFDLAEGGLFRVRLLNVRDEEHLLFFDIHHALADGRTVSLLNADLYSLYHRQPLPPVLLQQKDIAWHQFTHPNEADKAYWMGLFQGVLPKTDLPSDFPRPPVHTNRGGVHEFELSAELVAGMKDLARREGVTNYQIVLSAWSILVHAYTGAEDFVIATTVDGRGRHLATAGMLASLVPLRLAVGSAKPLGAVLQDNRKVSNEALRHTSYILNDLLTDLHPPVCRDRTLLSEIILSYMNFEFGARPQGLFETMRFVNPASKADLSIFGSDIGERISFALEYYADLFLPDSIARMAADFTVILELMVRGDTSSPVPFKPVPRQGARREWASRTLSEALGRGVRDFAAANGVAESAVMLAVFVALLCRVRARSETAVDLDRKVPLRFHVDADTEFDDLLAQVGAGMAGNGTSVAPGSGDFRDPADGRRIAFVRETEAAGPDGTGDADGYDLVCSVQDRAGRMEVRFDHDPVFLTPNTAQKWLGFFERIVQGLLQGSNQ